MTALTNQEMENKMNARLEELKTEATLINSDILQDMYGVREKAKSQEEIKKQIEELEKSNQDINQVLENPEKVILELREVKKASILDSFMFLPPSNPAEKMAELLADFDTEMAIRKEKHFSLYQKQIEVQKRFIEDYKAQITN